MERFYETFFGHVTVLLMIVMTWYVIKLAL